MGANAVLCPRVLVATALLNAALVPALVPYLAASAVIAALVAAVGAITLSADGDVAAPLSANNPLQLSASLQMALLFQVVIIIVSLVRDTSGRAGVLTTAAVLGLTDVDALTLSMARGIAHTMSLDTAALAIAIGVLANTALKMGVALLFGAPTFRVIVASTLILMMGVAAISIVLLM